MSLLLGGVLAAQAGAATVAELQAGYAQTLRDAARNRPPGVALLDLGDLGVTWPWWPGFYGSPARAAEHDAMTPSVVQTVALPDWARVPLAAWIADQGWPASAPALPREAQWPAVAVDKPLTPTAFVIAGPAVKDGVARYRREGGDVVARLGIESGVATQWMAAARTLGWGVQWRMREAPAPETHAEVVARAVFDTPAGPPRVWVVSPGTVVEARLLRLHWGGAGAGCESWIELRWPGGAELPVWAVVALANPAWAAGATAQRLPAKAGEAKPRGELRLSLPAAPGLAPLRLRASRYEFISADREAEPDAAGMLPEVKRGEAWGVRVWTEAAISVPHENWNTPPSLSASGSPRCPVR